MARTLIALGTLGTLTFSHTTSIFRNIVGVDVYPACGGGTEFGLFCLAGMQHLEIARWLSVVVLFLVVIGWRPRITGVLHWYVAASLTSSGVLVDGGDQVSGNLALLLIPVTLTDRRRWHWERPLPKSDLSSPVVLAPTVGMLFARSCIIAAQLQVWGIYFQSAVSKMRVEEWQDGTAVYYWFTDPAFGLWGPVRSFALPLLANGTVVAALTWGAVALELLLFMAIVAGPRYRRVMLVCGFMFHAGIALVHGLPSFALAMWGALILYLRPLDEEFRFARRWWDSLQPVAESHGRPLLGSEGLAPPLTEPKTS